MGDDTRCIICDFGHSEILKVIGNSDANDKGIISFSLDSRALAYDVVVVSRDVTVESTRIIQPRSTEDQLCNRRLRLCDDVRGSLDTRSASLARVR